MEKKIRQAPHPARRARAVNPALSVETQNRSSRRALNHPDLAVCGLVRRPIHESGEDSMDLENQQENGAGCGFCGEAPGTPA